MIQDRRTILSILMADVFVLAGAFFVLQDRYQTLKNRIPEATTSPAHAKGISVPPKSAPTVPVKPSLPAAPLVEKQGAAPSTATAAPAQKSTPVKQTRNIMFSYRNSKPFHVEIIGSFNNWTPQPLKKGANHMWTVTVPLEPGDYTYNYVVDGKVIRDPNNPRTAPEGRSLLTIKPLAR